MGKAPELFSFLFFLIKKETKKSRIKEWLRPFIRPALHKHPAIYFYFKKIVI